MQSDIPIRKAFGAECPVQRIFRNGAAVYRQEDAPAVRILPEFHIIPQPALHTAALIVIAPGALFCKVAAVPEAIYIEGSDVGADPAEIFDQFTVTQIDFSL